MEQEKIPSGQTPSETNDRREFLKKCGKYGAVTPPIIAMLLSTSLTSNAIAKSSRGNKFGWDKNGKR
jgi:hypothetical protein